MNFNLDEFRKREEQGLVWIKEHPHLPLLLYKYTPECAYSRAWDDYTLQARGLITDTEGNVVALPFRKFFNLGEAEETQIENLPLLVNSFCYEKLDGSCIALWYYDNQWHTSTLGSFESEQAVWAMDWLKRNGFLDSDPFNDGFKPEYTYLFEAIYPSNRIVVDYGKGSDMILLAVKENATGNELDPFTEGFELGVSTPTVFDVNEWYQNITQIVEQANSLPGTESEGFVVHWPEHNNLRVKIKGEDYVRLHRLMTDMNSKRIWETLQEGKSVVAVLDGVPDEAYKEIEQEEKRLISEYESIQNRAKKATKSLSNLETRKGQALVIMDKFKDISAVIFKMLDNKPYDDVIWKLIKPEENRVFTKSIMNLEKEG